MTNKRGIINYQLEHYDSLLMFVWRSCSVNGQVHLLNPEKYLTL